MRPGDGAAAWKDPSMKLRRHCARPTGGRAWGRRSTIVRHAGHHASILALDQPLRNCTGLIGASRFCTTKTGGRRLLKSQ